MSFCSPKMDPADAVQHDTSPKRSFTHAERFLCRWTFRNWPWDDRESKLKQFGHRESEKRNLRKHQKPQRFAQVHCDNGLASFKEEHHVGCRTCEENKIQVSGSPVLDDGTPEMHCDLACNVWNTKDENKKLQLVSLWHQFSINRSTNFSSHLCCGSFCCYFKRLGGAPFASWKTWQVCLLLGARQKLTTIISRWRRAGWQRRLVWTISLASNLPSNCAGRPTFREASGARIVWRVLAVQSALVVGVPCALKDMKAGSWIGTGMGWKWHSLLHWCFDSAVPCDFHLDSGERATITPPDSGERATITAPDDFPAFREFRTYWQPLPCQHLRLPPAQKQRQK